MRRLPQLLVLLLGLGAILLYVEGLPWVKEIPGWFYRPWDKHIDTRILAGLGAFLAAVGGMGAFHLLRARRRWAAGLLLVLASTALQLSTSALGGPDEIWKRHASGHGKYFRVVAERRGEWLDTLLDYEALARAKALDDYAPSKPPGVLVPYMMVDALARVPLVRHALEPITRHGRARPRVEPYAETAALSIFLLPLITALVAPALVLLGGGLFEDDAASWGGAVLWATAPATLLVQYHLDGAVYPLLAVLAAALMARGARRDRLAWSAAGGAVAMVGVYTSFSALVASGLAVGCLLLVLIDRLRAGQGRRALWRGALHLTVAAAAFVLVLALLTLLLRFDFGPRYEHAMDYHGRWKRMVPHDVWRWAALVEWGLYVGVPLVGVWLWRALLALGRLLRRRLEPAELGAAGLLALTVALSLASGTNEVSRMWLFLNPFVALSAATGLRMLSRPGPTGPPGRGDDRWQRPLFWIAATQVAVAFTMKGFQEW